MPIPEKSPDCTVSSNMEHGIIVIKRMPTERGFNINYLVRHEEKVFSFVVDHFVVSKCFIFDIFVQWRILHHFVQCFPMFQWDKCITWGFCSTQNLVEALPHSKPVPVWSKVLQVLCSFCKLK